MTSSAIVEVKVGAIVNAGADFLIPQKANTLGAIVTYELQDPNGIVYYTGSGYSLVEVSLTSSTKMLTALGNFAIPGQIPITRKQDKYRLVWRLFAADETPLASFIETFSISPATRDPFGVPDIVECLFNTVKLSACIPSDLPASVALYRRNEVLTSFVNITPSGVPAYLGNRYEYEILNAATLGIVESVEPYVVIWRYTDNVTGEEITEDGYLYHINPSILMAAKELQSMVNRSANTARLPETQMDFNVCIHFLKMGMDYFNSLGMPTYFNMINATGAVRSYWISCSMVKLLQSQYLMEAERAFTMNGQSVTLDFDISAAYESMAGTIQSQIDTGIVDFKKNLTRRGIPGGDGNIENPNSRASGASGIAFSPVSNFYAARYPRFKGFN